MSETAVTRYTDDDIAAWRTHGYVVIEGYLQPAEIERALEGMYRLMPSGDEYEAAPARYAALNTMVEFPFWGDELHDLTLLPDTVRLAETLLGTDDIVLDQSLVWGKYPDQPNLEQPIHLDYGNNTLVYPRSDSTFGKVVMITYLTDVTEDLGPTWILPREHEPEGEYWYPSIRPREMDPRLYEHERPVVASAGSMLVYGIDVFHRGSAFTATTGARMTHHSGWRARDSSWMVWRGYAHDGDKPEMQHFLERATPRERNVVGFPPVGHPYWNEHTLAGVAARYPGMDMTPYREALEAGRA
ncbi:MAG TPA: phytanoyl-CoA dioxygenase family protein [Ilumatobacter sp.]|nr:phytanoyl-CoA dioxygenase family protein [Ilumatobacter sp.]